MAGQSHHAPHHPRARASVLAAASATAAVAGATLRSLSTDLFLLPLRQEHAQVPALRAPRPSHPISGNPAASAAPRAPQAPLRGCGAAAAGALVGAVAARAARKPRPARAAARRRAGDLADCPYTVYGSKDIDVSQERERMSSRTCPLEVHMPEELRGNLEGQRTYFRENLPKIYRDLKEHGAVVFRGFELSKESAGFQQVGEALELEACEDPLHSVAARDAVDKKAGVYEAVNKPSRRKFYVGMHNEMVGNRAPGAAIFVCFKAAEEGGEFLVADGRELFRRLDEAWLRSVYDREVKYSTAEFPMGFLEQLGPLQGLLEPLAYGVLRQALNVKVDFDTELSWQRSGYDGSKILQVRAAPQVPVVRHPYTGEPAWWGSMHSHSEFLRREREKVFGDEALEEATGASRINRTDVYYADTGDRVDEEQLRHLDEVTRELSVPVKMQAGDMVLLDNYTVMHGRCPFEGTRKHAVTWYKSPDYSKAADLP